MSLLGKSIQEMEKKFLNLDRQGSDSQRKQSSASARAELAETNPPTGAISAQTMKKEPKGKRKADNELTKDNADTPSSSGTKKARQDSIVRNKQKKERKKAHKSISPAIRQEWKKLSVAVSKFEVCSQESPSPLSAVSSSHS